MERPYGLAIIINLKYFISDERYGSEVDVEKLGNIETHVDLRARKICAIVQEMAWKIKSDQSCFVCCSMTHGDMGVIYGSDSKPVEIKYITDLFKENKCSALAGKPKLFFIQACRGSQGRTPTTTVFTRIPAFDANALSEADGDIDYDDVNESTFRHSADPREPDFLIGYSTVAGKQSCTVSSLLPLQKQWGGGGFDFHSLTRVRGEKLQSWQKLGGHIPENSIIMNVHMLMFSRPAEVAKSTSKES